MPPFKTGGTMRGIYSFDTVGVTVGQPKVFSCNVKEKSENWTQLTDKNFMILMATVQITGVGGYFTVSYKYNNTSGTLTITCSVSDGGTLMLGNTFFYCVTLRKYREIITCYSGTNLVIYETLM